MNGKVVNADDEYVVTSVLEFGDRFEGQIFHRGDLESCEKVSRMLGAVSVTGSEAPMSARLIIVPVGEFDHPAGYRWRMVKPSHDTR